MQCYLPLKIKQIKRKLDGKIKLINHGSKRKHTIRYSKKTLGKAAREGGGVALSLSTVMIIILDESSVLSFSVFISPTLLVGL